MTENTLKVLCVLLVVFVGASLWISSSTPGEYDVNVYATQIPAGAKEGLDLRAVGELVKTAKDANDLERQINDRSLGLNNLDLDSDGAVDYISVEEFGSDDSRGFMLIAKLQGGRQQEVATIDIEKTEESQGDLEIRGNEQVYGANHYHHSRFGIGDYLMMRWLFRPHRLYRSPFSYGSYPGTYRRHAVVAPATYRARTTSVTQNSRLAPSTRSQLSSSHTSRVQSQKTSLRQATTSQRSFQTRSSGQSTRRGGFGRSTASVRSSRSSGGFRGGK